MTRSPHFLVAHLALLALVACTGTIGGDDGPGTMPPPTTVTVVVRDGTMPVVGVSVLFQNVDDSVLAQATTGPDGKAVAEMPAGGNVSVIRMYPTAAIPAETKPAQIYTYVGVKPGDVLDIAGELDLTTGTPNAINVKVPTTAEGTVRVMTPCGNGQGIAPTVAITVMGCALEVPFYVVDGNNQSFLMRKQVSENVDLSLGQLSDRLSATVSSTNKPMDISTINVEKKLQADTYELYSSGVKRIDQTPQTVTLPDLQGVDEVMVTAMTRTTGGTQIHVERSSYAPNATIIDASTIPRIPYTSRVMYSPTGVSWSQDGTGTVDFVFARLDVTRPDPGGGPYDVHFIRTIIAPPTGTNLRMPQVPVATYNPIADDTIAGTFALVRVDGGYDGARNKVLAYGDLRDIAPMNGTATISYSGTAP